MPIVEKHPQAEVDLLEIWLFIAEDSPDIADQFLDTLDEKFKMIAHSPYVGVARYGFRMFPVEDYNIFYSPIKEGIQVIRVLSARRNTYTLF